MLIVAAVVSVGLALASTRLLTRLGPARVVPVAFGASAVLLIGEWALVAGSRRLVAVLFYLHYAGLGAVLISGFWSVINERFDPRTAKRVLGSIAAGGTLGGVVGGLLAAQAANVVSVTTLLPLLAAVHLACGWLGLLLARSGRGAGSAAAPDARSGFAILAATPYLRTLLGLVVLTTVAEGLLDYAFKARARAEFASGEDLLRLFAWFHTAVAAAAFALQAGVARWALQSVGLARTVAALPTAVVMGGAAALALPGLGSVMVARGVEAVTRNGLYRAGYELLFTPLPPHEKRATKALVDVGAVRLGDVLAGLTVQATLMALAGPEQALLLGAIGIALAAAILTVGLQRGYAATLERGLLARAGATDESEMQDLATRTALLHTAGAVGVTLNGLEPEPRAGTTAPARATLAPAASPPPPGLARVIELESRDPARVRTALAGGLLPRALVSHVIPLLAWDAVARDAIAALRTAAPASVGAMADSLLDPGEDFAVRRRLPLVLAAHPSPRAVEALLAGLEDQRFEVRYRCGRALARLVQLDPSLPIDGARVRAAVLREVAVDRGVWESQRLLDQADDEGWSPVADELIRDRASRSVEHVFTMLALILPRQPLRVAFRGLHTDDQQLRGTALEYLEATLPDDIRRALWPFLEDHRTATATPRPTETVLRELLGSNQSIVINLEKLRKRRET
jgi:hypothetical protein